MYWICALSPPLLTNGHSQHGHEKRLRPCSLLTCTINWSLPLKTVPQSEQTCLCLFWLLFRGHSATAGRCSTTFTVNYVLDSIGARLAGPQGNTWRRYKAVIRRCPDCANIYRYDKVLFYESTCNISRQH